MKKFFEQNKNNAWFWIFAGLVVVLLFAMPMMSRNAGNSGDEDGFQWPYGEKIYDYYASGGKDTTCLADEDMGMHGGFFDQLTVAVVKTFKVEDYSVLRHGMNAMFGWICILFAGLLAYRIRDWRAAVITVALLFLSPRFLGHSFNNPKDLIFASMMMASIYYVAQMIRQYPKPKISTSVMLAIFAALAIVSRFAGFLLYAYLVLFLIIYHIMVNKKKSLSLDAMKTVSRYVLYVAAIIIVAFGLSIALWPYIMHAPLKTMVKVFHSMSSYFVSIRQVFEGTLQWSDYLPWYYTPKYILITIPIAVIIGMVLFFIFCWRKKEDRFWAFFVFFTFFFPVFWIVYTHANVYGGWRHAMFAYPPMVVAAGWGFDGLLRWIEKKAGVTDADEKSNKRLIINIAGIAAVLVLLAGPIRHIMVNHPYEYVYFNELAGGTKSALGNYEMDYYYHSTREASEWIIANAEKKADGSKVKVGTWHIASVNYFFRKDTADFKPTFVRWYEKENSDWDYAIFTITGMYPDYLKSKNFPPKNTVKTIDVDGVPICIILKREDKNDYEAFKQKEANNLDSAITLYHKALAYDPNNMGALYGLGELFVRSGRTDSAKVYLNRYKEIDKDADLANLMLAYAYMGQHKEAEALDILHEGQKTNPKYMGAHILAIQIALQMNDLPAAKKEFYKVIDVDRVDNQVVQLWLQYSSIQNIDQNTAYRNLYKAMIKSLEKRGKKKEAEKLKESIGL